MSMDLVWRRRPGRGKTGQWSRRLSMDRHSSTPIWDLFKNFQIGESKKIQLRFNAYNFLNHPLWSFISGSANLKPTFDVNGKQTNSIFGVTTEKQGQRIIQLAVKFYF